MPTQLAAGVVVVYYAIKATVAAWTTMWGATGADGAGMIELSESGYCSGKHLGWLTLSLAVIVFISQVGLVR
jgi:hypothetical protein